MKGKLSIRKNTPLSRLIPVSIIIHFSTFYAEIAVFSRTLDVALVANFAEDLADRPTGAQLVKYILILAPAWHISSDLREIMNSFYTDDLIQRLIILWIMALLVIYGNNATLVAENLGALRTTVGCVMCARLTMAAVHVVTSFASWQHRVQSRIMAGCMGMGVVIWTPLLIEGVSIRAKIAVATVAIAYQEACWMLTCGPWIKKKLGLEYSTAVDIAHEIDRLVAFYIIILGEYLYSIVVKNPAAVGLNGALLKAIWTLIIAFCLNWLYVNGDGTPSSIHPIRHSASRAFAFFGVHLPLAASLLVGGHVAAVSASVDYLETGERWLLGGGLGVGLVCLWVHGMLFDDQEAMLCREGQSAPVMMPKWMRMAMRLIVGIIITLLPLTNDEDVRPTLLLSIIMALTVFVTVWETVSALQKNAGVFERWEGRNQPLPELNNAGADGV